jgi:general secretion pathway protein C
MILKNDNNLLWPRAVTFVLSAGVAASVVYWGVKEWRIQVMPDAPASPSTSAPVTTAMVARALGGGMQLAAKNTIAPTSTRYSLVGIIANRSGGGAALISVDGKTAKPVRVGAFIDDRLMLQSVEGRRALLAGGANQPAEVTLDLPKPGK